MKLLIKLIAMAALLVLAMVASHFLLYKPLIVPRLPALYSVPLAWWFGLFAPQLIVFIIVGLSLTSWRELIFFSVVAAFIQKLFNYTLWTWNEPGHLKTFESPVSDWTLGLLALIAISAVLLSAGFVTGAAMKRNWKPA